MVVDAQSFVTDQPDTLSKLYQEKAEPHSTTSHFSHFLAAKKLRVLGLCQKWMRPFPVS